MERRAGVCDLWRERGAIGLEARAEASEVGGSLYDSAAMLRRRAFVKPSDSWNSVDDLLVERRTLGATLSYSLNSTRPTDLSEEVSLISATK